MSAILNPTPDPAAPTTGRLLHRPSRAVVAVLAVAGPPVLAVLEDGPTWRPQAEFETLVPPLTKKPLPSYLRVVK